jgi:alpha/beta superfamily hydrolase
VAQSNLGVLYEKGLGVKKSYLEAATWYRKSAEQGEPTAQCNIGKAYDYGRGVPQDYKQAASWYRKAAEQGYASAQLNFGYLCYRGLGVLKSHADAYFWMSIAAPEMKRKVRRRVEREIEIVATKLTPEQLSRAKRRVKQHLGHSVTGAGKKRDKIKKAIREAKLAMKETADYVVEIKKEQVRAQKSLEKAELNLARLKAKLDAVKGE